MRKGLAGGRAKTGSRRRCATSAVSKNKGRDCHGIAPLRPMRPIGPAYDEAARAAAVGSTRISSPARRFRPLLRPFAIRSKTFWPPGQRPRTKSESRPMARQP
jgi:hypothetical protein